MGKKIISLLLTAALLVTTMGLAAAAVPETVQDKLALLEEDGEEIPAPTPLSEGSS